MKTVISIKFDRNQTKKDSAGEKHTTTAEVTYLKETLNFKEGIKTKHAVNRSLDFSESMLRDMFIALREAEKPMPSKLYCTIETSAGLVFNTHGAAKQLLTNGSTIAKSAYIVNLSKKDKDGLTVEQLADKYIAQFRANVKFANTFVNARTANAAKFDTNGKAVNNLTLSATKVTANGEVITTDSEVPASENNAAVLA